MGTVERATSYDATIADANDNIAATTAVGGATNDDDHAAGKHDGTLTAAWRAKPVWTDLLTRRGGFY